MDYLFEKNKNGPEEWLTTATHLKKAADILFAECPTGWAPDGEPINRDKLFVLAPASMLYGFALENAIKGYLIERSGSYDIAVSANEEAWKGHRLQALAAGTCLPLTEQQNLLLTSVEALICWGGRYPVPLRRGKFTLNKQLNAENNTPPIVLDKVERDIIDPFYRAVTDALHASFLAKLSNPSR
jgi:hypothetical protein